MPFPGTRPESFSLDRFDGINTQATRMGIEDQQCSWLENMLPIGPNNCRTIYDVGTTLYTAPGGKTIVAMFPFNVSSSQFIAFFLSDGTAQQAAVPAGTVVNISAVAGTFYDGTALPACAQIGSSGIVIVSQVVATNNTYWAWDSTTLFGPGSASPTWLNGGTPTTMPNGVRGTYVESYLSRVIIDNGNTKLISAPGNGATFSGTVGGLTITATDSFLRVGFTAAKQANGFLYNFGDSSIQVISNIVSQGSPIVTTLNNQNVDPQVGTPWPESVQVFGNAIIFANTSGVYELRGGSAIKISDELDGIFGSAVFSQTLLSRPKAAVATIFGIRCYMLLISLLDPFTLQQRFAMCMWSGKKWFIGSQTISLTTIATQEINSILTAWGTNGTIAAPMFTTASGSLPKIIQSKLWQGSGRFITLKQVLRAYTLIQNNTAVAFTGTLTVDTVGDQGNGATVLNLTSVSTLIFVNDLGQVINFVNGSSQLLIFINNPPGIFGEDAQGCYGGLIGITVNASAPDFTAVALLLEYQGYTPFGG